MSLILSTQCKEPVTVEQLLGEEPSDADVLAAAEERLRRLQAGE